MTLMRPYGVTIALQAGDDAEALGFYTALFGRAPDYSPHTDFHEWEISPNAWVQVRTGCHPVTPASNRLRFQVADLPEAARALHAAGLTVGAPCSLPGGVTFADLADPWGNPLGLFEDIAGPQGPAVPGGTVRDESHFVA